MKILMVTAETVPFAKTGGLADMVSALAIQLTKMGHDVKIVMPRYYKIDRSKLTLLEGPMAIAAGQSETWSAVYTTTMPGCDKLSVYFIDHEQCFGRDGIYGTKFEPDFPDTNPTEPEPLAQVNLRPSIVTEFEPTLYLKPMPLE